MFQGAPPAAPPAALDPRQEVAFHAFASVLRRMHWEIALGIYDTQISCWFSPFVQFSPVDLILNQIFPEY